jgi:hypothetical protein
MLNADTWVRTGAPRKKKKGAARTNAREIRRDPKRESLRWSRAVTACEGYLDVMSSAIHVMDREGDNFDLFAALHAAHHRFVIRLSHDRNVLGEERKLRAAVSRAACVFTRTVRVSSRKPTALANAAKIHPPREEREVTLEVSAQSVELVRPTTFAPGSPKALRVNVVVVKERACPSSEKPIEWHLLTTEPIETEAQIASIVDAYRARWIIEEFFKALKTGCQFEKRQLESYTSIRVALGIFLPIAVRLLSLRSAARSQPDVACSNVLGRAYEKLLVLEQGWIAAKKPKRSDR